MKIAGKELPFKRPTLKLTVEVNDLVMSSELFQPLPDLHEIYKNDPERFKKLSEDWAKFCALVFDGDLTGLELENTEYPDDVVEAQAGFFTMPWEKTRKRFESLNQSSGATTSQAKQ